MASKSRDSKGWRVHFVDKAKKRRTIRLGGASEPLADHVLSLVEELTRAVNKGEVLNSKTVRLLVDLPDAVHAKLAKVGLVAPRVKAQSYGLGTALTEFFATVDVKPATRTRMEQVQSVLIENFKASRCIATISAGDAGLWRGWLKNEKKYAQATISRTILYARQMFSWAVRRGMMTENPFADIKAGSQVNSARQVYIDRETVLKVMEAAPDLEWRLLIALSRYCGLRVPSEVLALTWRDVNWDHKRLTVRSPKTEHHEGRAERMGNTCSPPMLGVTCGPMSTRIQHQSSGSSAWLGSASRARRSRRS